MCNDANTVKFISFNCKDLKRSVDWIKKLCRTNDVIALQETWLLPHDIPFLGTIDEDFGFTGKSAVDTSARVLVGRPYGGVALLWRKNLFTRVSVITCCSDRLTAIKIALKDRSLLVFSVYMPYDTKDKNMKEKVLAEFTQCLSEISAIVESHHVDSVYMLGDYNAHPGERFALELSNFCAEQSWSCVDLEMLPKDSYTYVSDAHGSHRWLDHCVVTEAARPTVKKMDVLYDIYWGDHYPIQLECDINLIKSKIIPSDMYSNNNNLFNGIIWGERDESQIDNYLKFCHSRLRDINFPVEFINCADRKCSQDDHKLIINKLYNDIVSILTDAAKSCYRKKRKKCKQVAGWDKHVRAAHGRSRLCFQTWQRCGKPSAGQVYDDMVESRRVFKSKLKWCQNNEQQLKMDKISKHHSNKDFKLFWKTTNRLSPKPSLPVSVAGVHDPAEIAKVFQAHFRVDSPLGPSDAVFDDECRSDNLTVRFTAKDVATVIKNMVRGKSPGYDNLSIEHLQHAGVHLPRVLSLLFNLCVSHSYLPEELMRTTVVPIVKNKTGDASDLSNYRPISLATIVAKVLDSLLDRYLGTHLKLNDAQFGFRPGLSTESAILCLKQTVHYYTARKTPVYACYLDLSKAFDLVSYDLLWDKLKRESDLPDELRLLFRYWYGHQTNRVKWAGTYSDVYRLECGVRQGGVSSPTLFNLYMNSLIEELSSTKVGCHIDGICFNNISYADDMVLLSPSVSGLRKLLRVCETYAAAHGLRYNVTKSEYMIFKAKSKDDRRVPPIHLYGSQLNRVKQFKYLGHWVTEDLKDSVDMERERRALSVRCNMLARRFARCTRHVKVTLFKSYCQSLYTSSLWVNYTQKTYNALRVQYNNVFRVMLGLPRHCSASGMFCEAHTDGFHAILRKQCASLLKRLRVSTNIMLSTLSDRWDLPLLAHWLRLHSTHNGLTRCQAWSWCA